MTLTDIHEVWIKLEKRFNGKLEFNEHLKANVLANIITASIEYEFRGYKIEVHQGIFEQEKGSFTFRPLEIRTEIETNSNFDLNTWRISFIDRLINQNRLRTGYKEFDKTVGIKGFNKTDLLEFFKNDRIRNNLMADKMINLQIKNEKGRLNIRLNVFKSSNKIEVVEQQIVIFELIIKQLEKIRIIGNN